MVRGGVGDRGQWLRSLLFCAHCDARDVNQARERVQGEGSIPRLGLAMVAEGLEGSIGNRLVLVARRVRVVRTRMGILVALLLSSQCRLRHLYEDHLPASMQHEVRGDNPRAG